MGSSKKINKALLITRVEGSERLESRLGTLYNNVLKKQHEIIHSLLNSYENHVIESQEDSTLITFASAEEAVRAAIAFQQFISHHIWPNNETVNLKIGLHWAIDIADENNRDHETKITSSICDAAHGEQILLSQTLVDKLEGKQVHDLNIHRMGDFLLKDFDDTITLFQLDVPGLKTNFPLLKTISTSPSIAVLPFYNMNEDSRDDYLGLGIAEEIIISLAKNPGLRVLTRATTFGVNSMLKIEDLGKVLNASMVLDGTVRKDKENISLTVGLTDIKSGNNIWEKRFEGNAGEILSIQEKITTSVTKSLVIDEVHIPSTPVRTLQTNNFEAYEKYLRGNKFYNQYSLQSIQFAKQMYQNAMQLDRSYGLAYCGLANCYSYLYMYSVPGEENLRSAEQLSKKAIKLNSSLPEAYAAYGVALSIRGNYDDSEKEFEKAISLDPMLYEAHYQYGRMAFSRGDFLKASAQFEAASRIRQDDYQALLLNGQCYDSLGDEEKAIETRIQGVHIAEDVLQLNPGNVRALYMGANGLVAIGDNESRKKGLKWLERAITLEPDDPMLLYNAGCIYALCTMEGEALNCLERSVATGLTQKTWYEQDSNLNVLRGTTRFEKILATL